MYVAPKPQEHFRNCLFYYYYYVVARDQLILIVDDRELGLMLGKAGNVSSSI
jgi:hypothetical protein